MSKVQVNLDKLFDGKLQKPTTLNDEQKKQRDSLIFPVNKVSFKDEFGLDSPSSCSHAIISEHGEQKRLIGTCSKNYALKPIDEVIKPIEDELFKKFKVTPHYKMEDKSRFYIDWILEEANVKISKSDLLKPTVKLTHSYDSKVPFSLNYGFYRLVCSNGMTVFNSKASFKSKHSVYKLDDSESIIENFVKKICEEIPEYVQNFEILSDKKIENFAERVESVLEATTFPKRFAKNIEQLVQNEQKMLELEQPNDWLLYNSFNNVLNHNKVLKKTINQRQKIDSEVMDFLVSN